MIPLQKHVAVLDQYGRERYRGRVWLSPSHPWQKGVYAVMPDGEMSLSKLDNGQVVQGVPTGIPGDRLRVIN